MFLEILTLAVMGALVTVILKKHCRELVPFFEIAVLIGGLFIIGDLQSANGSSLEKLFSIYAEGNEAFSAIFKAASVAVLSRLAADMCKESGNGLMGDIVELGGRITLIILALPFIEKVTETAISFI